MHILYTLTLIAKGRVYFKGFSLPSLLSPKGRFILKVLVCPPSCGECETFWRKRVVPSASACKCKPCRAKLSWRKRNGLSLKGILSE